MSKARRRALLGLAAALVGWGVVVLVTGGFIIETPWRTITSRAAIRPFIAAGILLLYYGSRWRHHWRADLEPLANQSWASVVASAAILVTFATGFFWGTRIGGGPDASGYVSQAAMFVRGELTLRTPEWARNAPWNDAALTSAPVGYRPARETELLAPTYSPGYPLLMAVFQLAAGPGAVFYIVPLLGAVVVWATWRLGQELGGQWVGAAAAALLATSAAFTVMVVQVMSDVPGTALWTLSLLAAVRGRASASGMATAVATLVRPNIVALAIVPMLLLAFHEPKGRVPRLVAFAVPMVPAAAAIGLLNWYYHGSPLRSGYGSLGELYSVDRIGLNLQRYRSWFFSSQTPLPLFGLAAAAFAQPGRPRFRAALVTLVFPLVLFALYLPYLVFQPQEWGYLRFLLPAYPPLMIGFAMTAAAASRAIPKPAIAKVAATTIVAAVCGYSWQFATANNVYRLKQADERYAHAVEYVKRLPARSVIVSLAHSGTIRFYTGRDVLRFEALPADDVDTAFSYLRDRGYSLYLVGDAFEVEMFRERIAGTPTAAWLERAPYDDIGGSFVYTLSAGAGARRN